MKYPFQADNESTFRNQYFSAIWVLGENTSFSLVALLRKSAKQTCCFEWKKLICILQYGDVKFTTVLLEITKPVVCSVFVQGLTV